jgi:shikimate dehydrogenase
VTDATNQTQRTITHPPNGGHWRVGLIGYPLAHSISPAFQNAAFLALGLPVEYGRWETPPERLAALVAGLREPDALGANVTIPYKQAVLPLLDGVDSLAQAVGAVNTIVHQGNRLIGSNTDVDGFARALCEDAGENLEGRYVVVLGAGGAARAVATAAGRAGAAEISICARRLDAAIALVTDLAGGPMRFSATFHARALADAIDALAEADIVINATPLGTAHHPQADSLPVPVEALPPRALVCDLVYNPPVTPWLAAAAARDLRTLNGLSMLIYQGAAAFEQWTGQSAPIAVMRESAQQALEEMVA